MFCIAQSDLRRKHMIKTPQQAYKGKQAMSDLLHSHECVVKCLGNFLDGLDNAVTCKDTAQCWCCKGCCGFFKPTTSTPQVNPEVIDLVEDLEEEYEEEETGIDLEVLEEIPPL
jgi:hypothetical protein